MCIRDRIIPDLPTDSEDSFALTQNLKLKSVPVVSVNSSFERLTKLLNIPHSMVYLMSGTQVTGKGLQANKNLSQQIKTIRKTSKSKLGVGFGIQSIKDLKWVLKRADIAIIGSAFIEAREQGDLENFSLALKNVLDAENAPISILNNTKSRVHS